MHCVLDLDLDFFLSDVCPFADEGKRPDDACARAWTEEEMRDFLENTLKLTKARPIPGRVFETHDRALDFWEELIGRNVLCAPFSVTHVDAHTDLGILEKGYPFIRHTVLAKPVQKRVQTQTYRDMKQLTEANYLAFALAYRWVSVLENVRNPASLKDFPTEMLTPDGNSIHLFTAFPALFEAKNGPEPVIDYKEYGSGAAYQTENVFCAASLAVSPRYTPENADKLIKVFKEYIVGI